MKLESEVKSRCAQYPHRVLTRGAVPMEVKDIRKPTFIHRLLNLKKMAKDLNALSFCGPKGHWDSNVIIFATRPDEEYTVWVNPVVPGYDDKASVAPMYGMWENCAACGAACAWIIRPQKISVTGYDEYGNSKQEVLGGMAARLLMHELDHLNGKSIIQQALGPDFIVSQSALSQKNLWPANFPSAEAHMTSSMQFFDYVSNQTIVPAGLEWYYMQMAYEQFGKDQIEST